MYKAGKVICYVGPIHKEQMKEHKKVPRSIWKQKQFLSEKNCFFETEKFFEIVLSRETHSEL